MERVTFCPAFSGILLMKPVMRVKLAQLPFEEKIRKVGELIRIRQKIKTDVSNISEEAALLASLEQTRRFHPLCPGREFRRRTAPAQRLGIFEERRISAQRCEILEEQCEITLFAENV